MDLETMKKKVKKISELKEELKDNRRLVTEIEKEQKKGEKTCKIRGFNNDRHFNGISTVNLDCLLMVINMDAKRIEDEIKKEELELGIDENKKAD